MIARKSDCDIQQLSVMLASPLEETLDAERQAAVARHLDHCPFCRQQLERLAADQPWWEDTRQTLRDLQAERTTSVSTGISHSSIATKSPLQPSTEQPSTEQPSNRIGY